MIELKARSLYMCIFFQIKDEKDVTFRLKCLIVFLILYFSRHERFKFYLHFKFE